MALMSILSRGTSLNLPNPKPNNSLGRRTLKKKHASTINVPPAVLPEGTTSIFVSQVFKPSIFRIRSLQREDAGNYEAAKDALDGQHSSDDQARPDLKDTANAIGSPFLMILVLALGAAAIISVVSAGVKWHSSESFFGIQCLAESSQSSVKAAVPGGFTLKAFGYRIILPEYAPGWIYFWLLMAAGCGLFISEEALNIWVGITLSRMLSLDGTWSSFTESFSSHAPYVISTMAWVYWGVCISDMIPFYLGKLFRQSGATDDVCLKLGIGEEKTLKIRSAVQKYGNLIGIVERLSLGVRNPTAFVAGALGVSPECFFAGVCCGGLITLPLQLGIGFLLRERPVFALATVATVVGIWTVLPYFMAASTALFLYLRQHYST